MRTANEIVDRCLAKGDIFGFSAEALAEFLTFEEAKPLLKDTATPDKWECEPRTREAVIRKMADYMNFAWGKVEGHRGISASRSVDKMRAWVWLLGDDDALREIERAEYAQYGAPKLAVVCHRYGFPIPADEWATRMIAGEPCGAYEGCGCGR